LQIRKEFAMTLPNHSGAGSSASAEIRVEGRFDFTRNRDSKKLCTPALADSGFATIVVDLQRSF
jgi:hypothetical protein